MNIKKDDNCLQLLEEAKQRLAFIEQSNNLGYWELDISHNIMFWSPQVYKIFGIAACEAKKSFIRQRLHPEDLKLYKNALYNLLKYHNSIAIVLRIYINSKDFIYCQFRASLIHRDNKKYIIGTIQNVDSLVQKQQDVSPDKEDAEQINHDKVYYYAQMSHDLRQPLQAIKIFISLLKEENLSKEQSNILSKIDTSINNLGFILDNFLEAGKLDRGAIIRKDNFFDLGKLLTHICSEYSEFAKNQKVKLTYHGDNIITYNDVVLLERIFRNLLNNAIKYSRGIVYIHWYQVKNIIRIIVKDNGYGFGPEMQQNLFKAYWQNPLHRSMGAGLGLAIVKELSDILQLDIKVKSKEGRGTIFILTLSK